VVFCGFEAFENLLARNLGGALLEAGVLVESADEKQLIANASGCLA
jgi:hypothetical protein